MAGYQDLLRALASMGSDQQQSFQIPGTISAAAAQPSFSSRDVTQVFADEAQAKQRMALAQSLMGGMGQPVHGPIGALAQVLGVIAGSKMQKGANEKYADVAARRFDLENRAAIAKIQAEADAKVRTVGQEDQAKIGSRMTTAKLIGLEQGSDAYKRYVGTGELPKEQTPEMQLAQAKLDALNQLSPAERMRATRIDQGLEARAQGPTEIDRKIALAQKMGATPEQIQQMVVGNQAPTGYRAVAGGGLEAIPGGPADPSKPQPMAGEVRVKVGLLNNAQTAFDEFKKIALKPDGSLDPIAARMPEATRALRDAIGNKLRAESGAAISDKEIDNEMARYAPQFFASGKTNVAALERFGHDVQGQLASLTQGTTAETKPKAAGAQGAAKNTTLDDPLGIR